jgi:hypothetical protein
VAWLAWQDVSAVRLLFPAYAKQTVRWRRVTPEAARVAPGSSVEAGWVLAPDLPPTITAMIAAERAGQLPSPELPKPRVAVEGAFSLLGDQLLDSRGLLVAAADKIDTDATDELAPASWDTLAFGELQNALGQGVDVLCRMPSRKPIYIGARVRRADVLHIIPRFLEADRTIEGAIAEARPAKLAAKRGRKLGSKNWDDGPFRKFYRARLDADGLPERGKRRGWTSFEAAASTVLAQFTETLANPDDQPSLGTAKGWGNAEIEQWKADLKKGKLPDISNN